MQRGRQGRNELFDAGDPFGDFRRFGGMACLFGGRDPFDAPFFTRPFGSMSEHAPCSATGEAVYNNTAKAVVIEELSSDDEGEEGDVKTGDEKSNAKVPRGASEEPSVEHPDDDDHDVDEEGNNVKHRNDRVRTKSTEPQGRNFNFQSSKVTYGGVDGAYYTSTRARRAGSDGVLFEERKEADKTTGQATHKITRGIHDQGHSVTRKLNSYGTVDTTQTLHNLDEDELTGFEKEWNDNFRGQLPGLSSQFEMHGTTGSNSSEQKGTRTWGGRLLPSYAGWRGSDIETYTNSSRGQNKKVVRINIE